MKKFAPLWTIIGVLIVGGGVFWLTRYVSGNFLDSKANADKAAKTCQRIGTTHTVIISGDKTEPAHTTAQRCDKLVITNNDEKIRDMAFGVHDHHVAYDGVTIKTLTKGQSLTVTLNETGTFLFHDHHQEEVGGDFTVK